MFFIFLIVFWFLTSILGLLLEKYGENKKMKDYSIRENGWVYSLPLIGSVVLVIEGARLCNKLSEKVRERVDLYNIIYRCRSCGILSRLGYIELTELVKEKKMCPHCEDKNVNLVIEDLEDHSLNLPLSPKFDGKKVAEIEKIKKDKKQNSLVDEQYEKYIKLQKEKLKQNLEKVGENNEC